MELMEAIRKRRSIRKFKEDKIPKEDIYEIIEAATLAPSAHNRQMWHFIAVSNEAILKKMGEAVVNEIEEVSSWPELDEGMRIKVRGMKAYSTFFVKAPLVFVVLVKPYHSMVDELSKLKGGSKGEIEFWHPRLEIQSVAAAVENMLLAAADKGYGACWMGGPLIAASALKEILKIEDPWQLMALVPLGIPDQEARPKVTKKIEEVLEFRE